LSESYLGREATQYNTDYIPLQILFPTNHPQNILKTIYFFDANFPFLIKKKASKFSNKPIKQPFIVDL